MEMCIHISTSRIALKQVFRSCWFVQKACHQDSPTQTADYRAIAIGLEGSEAADRTRAVGHAPRAGVSPGVIK